MQDEASLNFLLACEDPSIRYWTRRDLLDLPEDHPEVRAAREAIPGSPRVQALLAGQLEDGSFGGHPYQKWGGAHWRLVSLVELGAPPDHPEIGLRLRRAAGTVLDWLAGAAHRANVPCLEGRYRRCASQEGNALAVCARLGYLDDPRVALLAESLVEWQWPDGGWNCDRRAEASHSSFYESLAPLWGLSEYARAAGDSAAAEAAGRAAELFLRHCLFLATRTGEPIHADWLKLHYPLYWHYDILGALLVLSRHGPLDDPRLMLALDRLEALRLKEGGWRAGAYYWRPPGAQGSGVEAVDWGRGGPSPFLTLNALRVLKAAGRA